MTPWLIIPISLALLGLAAWGVGAFFTALGKASVGE